MNDYWNDPPEYLELPECCGEEMEVNDDGDCKCLKCGAFTEAQPDIEPPEEVSELCAPKTDKPPESDHCCHGKKWGDCDTCDYLSDIAFDAAREGRI
jgi:hypothetical protein